jgi:hypothetical protein
MSPNELDINPIISIIILLLNDANAASVMDHVLAPCPGKGTSVRIIGSCVGAGMLWPHARVSMQLTFCCGG